MVNMKRFYVRDIPGELLKKRISKRFRKSTGKPIEENISSVFVAAAFWRC